jgi:hypothetical protein
VHQGGPWIQRAQSGYIKSPGAKGRYVTDDAPNKLTEIPALVFIFILVFVLVGMGLPALNMTKLTVFSIQAKITRHMNKKT